MNSCTFRIAFILILISSCAGQEQVGIAPKWAAMFIGDVLYRAHTSGSITYRGDCESHGASEDLPALRTPRNKDASPVQTLREMFADDPTMRVMQEPDGKIRMADRNVPTDLLEVKIRHISFTSSITTSSAALWEILWAPEVEAFMKTRNIGPMLPDNFSFSILLGSDSKPMVARDLDNVRVSQALDYILQSYPGFWTYEDCAGRGGRTVFFRFFPATLPGIAKLP